MKTRIKVLIGIGAVILVISGFVGFMLNNMRKQDLNEDPLFWEDDINEILEEYDEYPDVDIVFIGSSSIRKWTTLEADFEGFEVLNHGFGGSKVKDSTYWYDELITPFNPEVIVVFSGTNDINGSSASKTGEEVFNLVVEFFEKSQEMNPDIIVYYISISPTKARWDNWEEANDANELVKDYALNQDKLVFIDTTEQLLKDGVPNKDLFVFDGLHLNEEGYELWTSIIKPIVVETIE